MPWTMKFWPCKAFCVPIHYRIVSGDHYDGDSGILSDLVKIETRKLTVFIQDNLGDSGDSSVWHQNPCFRFEKGHFLAPEICDLNLNAHGCVFANV